MSSTTAPGQVYNATSNPRCRTRCSDGPSHATSAYPSRSSRRQRCASARPKSSPAPECAEPGRRPGNGYSGRAIARSCDPSAQSPTARPSDLSSTRTTPPNRSWLALDSPRESDSSGTGIRGGLPTRKPALAGFVGPYGGYPAFDRGARPRHPPHRLPSRGVSQPINATERANSSLPLSIKARILGSVSPDNPTDDGWPSGVKDGAVYAIPPMK